MCPMTFTSDGNTGSGSAVPFQRTIDPQKLGMYLNLEQAELLRIQRYGEHWRFYYGKHWAFTREDGDPLVTLNYFRKVIDKSADFLCIKGFALKVADPLHLHTLPFLNEVWKYNKKQKVLWDMAITGGVTGDVFVLVTYKAPTPLEQRIFPYAQGRIVINLLGSEQVFPDWDPLDKSRMRSCRIETLFYDPRPTKDIGKDDQSSAGRQLNVRRFTQIITPDTITEHLQGEDPKVRSNILGEIPIVHIKNLPAPSETYGIPDGLDIVNVNREINEKSTDCSDIVNYHAAPITVIQGAKAKDLERGPRQIWSGLPENAKVFNLNLEGDLGAAKDYIDFVKEAMMELSDTPEGSLGKSQPISNTAGVALHMQYAPLMEKTIKKRVQYGEGIVGINYFILRIGHVMGMINLPFDIDRKTGGKIALVEEPVLGQNGTPMQGANGEVLRKRIPKSFLMDPASLRFMHPNYVKLKYVRQYSFGSEIREDPYWKILAEHRGVSQSFWDPEPATTVDDEANRKLEEEENAQIAEGQELGASSPAKVPKKVGVPKLPAFRMEIPEEPVTVEVIEQKWDPSTGDLAGESRAKMELVPTGELLPEYLNPYESEVAFHDPLPKDLQLQAHLFQAYLAMGIVSRRWIQEHIPEIAPYIDMINDQIDKERSESSKRGSTSVNLEDAGDEQGREAGATDQSPSAKGGVNVSKRNEEERGSNTGRQ